jgi:nitrogen fixation/metabolism regulation signal transduction histidine kinase
MTAVSAPLHPAASHHLPSFITAPGETDIFMVVMGVILVLCVVMFGVLFFRLHTLPERIAHRQHKLQMEIVAVLGLLALFTHMHLFWVAGLLLALIDLPDIGGWLSRIGTAVEKIADIKPDQSEKSAESTVAAVAEERSVPGPKRATAKPKELIHA